MPAGSPELEESHSVLTYGEQEMQWERSETNTGIPYYIRHDTHKTQWDHPEMTKVLHDLDGMNNIQYAAYRTAMKLRAVQKVCWLHVVKKHTLMEAWEQHGLGDDQNASIMTPLECEAVLRTAFSLSKGDRPDDILNPDQATQIALSWVTGLVDSGRTGNINVQMAKICLMTVCSAQLREKYEYMVEQVAFPKKQMSEAELRTLIQHILLIPKQVFETGTFNSEQTEPAIDSCYKFVGSKRGRALGMEAFLQWMSQEPRFIVWLPTMHRLAASETVKHESKCASCNTFPIVGLRFRCLKAFNTDLCQNCYLTKDLPKNVKPSHPFREYSVATSSGDDLKDFGKVLRNKVTKSYKGKPPKKSYLDHPLVSDGQPTTAGDGGTEYVDERITVVEAGQFDRQHEPELEPVMFENRHSRIGQLAGRLQELENQHDGEIPAGSPRAVAVEVHTETGEPPSLTAYQSVEPDSTRRNFPNLSYQPPARETKSISIPQAKKRVTVSPASQDSTRVLEKPLGAGDRDPYARSDYRNVEHPEQPQESGHGREYWRSEDFDYTPHFQPKPMSLGSSPAQAQPQPQPAPRKTAYSPESGVRDGQRGAPRWMQNAYPGPPQPTQNVYAVPQAVPRNMRVVRESTPIGAGATSPGQAMQTPGSHHPPATRHTPREFADSSSFPSTIRTTPQQSGYYAQVLPPEDASNEQLRQVLADLVTQKDALVQDLVDLKNSTTFLSSPVVVEKPSGVDPSFYNLQKDYMNTRLDAKEQRIRQLEHQVQALRKMIIENEVEPVQKNPQEPKHQEMATNEQVRAKSPSESRKVSRGVNISTSYFSEASERSFYGNPEQELASIVQGMLQAFPSAPGKVQPCSMDNSIYQAASKVSQNFTSFSQELMGK